MPYRSDKQVAKPAKRESRWRLFWARLWYGAPKAQKPTVEIQTAPDVCRICGSSRKHLCVGADTWAEHEREYAQYVADVKTENWFLGPLSFGAWRDQRKGFYAYNNK